MNFSTQVFPLMPHSPIYYNICEIYFNIITEGEQIQMKRKQFLSIVLIFIFMLSVSAMAACSAPIADFDMDTRKLTWTQEGSTPRCYIITVCQNGCQVWTRSYNSQLKACTLPKSLSGEMEICINAFNGCDDSAWTYLTVNCDAPVSEPTSAPTEKPIPVPTEEPTPVPTEKPTPVPTEEPTPVRPGNLLRSPPKLRLPGLSYLTIWRRRLLKR